MRHMSGELKGMSDLRNTFARLPLPITLNFTSLTSLLTFLKMLSS